MIVNNGIFVKVAAFGTALLGKRAKPKQLMRREMAMNIRMAVFTVLGVAFGLCVNQRICASGGEGLGADIDIRSHDFYIDPGPLPGPSNRRLARFFRVATAESLQPFLDQEHLLQLAARYTSNADIVTFLIDSGLDPNAAFGYGIEEYPQDSRGGATLREGPLHYAAAYNPEPKVVEALVKGGADVDAVGGMRLETPLHYAARYNNAAVVLALVKGGASPNAVNGLISPAYDRSANINGNRPLHRAVCNPDAAVIDALVGAGANVEGRNSSGFLPLHFAAVCAQVGSIAALKRHGADFGAVVTLVEEEDQIHDCTDCNVVQVYLDSLIEDNLGEGQADLSGTRDFLKALVDAGASVNAEGFSPLMLAVEGSLGPEVVGPLLELGAEAKPDLLHVLLASTFQYSGKSAGGYFDRNVASAKNVAVLDQLLGQKGIDVNMRDSCGRTPLHRAAAFAYYQPTRGIEKVIAKLITAGADVNTRLDVDADGYGRCDGARFTPLHQAAQWGSEQNSGYAIASVLLAAGADADVRDPAGKSAWDIADGDRMKELLASEVEGEEQREEQP